MSFVQPPFWATGHRGPSILRTTSVVVTPPATEPLTLAEAKLRAGQTWADGDARDALLQQCIVAARMKVEGDTGLSLITQTRDVTLSAAPFSWTLRLPALSSPLQSITSITSVDTSDVPHVLDVSQYAVDLPGGRIGLTYAGAWPSDLRPTNPITIRLVAGFGAAADVPAPLALAVGMLAAHYFTAGRDAVQIGRGVEVAPLGYDHLIEQYQQVSL